MALFFYALKHQENKTKFWISPGAAEHTHKKTFISNYKAFRDFDVLKMQQKVCKKVTYMRLYCQKTNIYKMKTKQQIRRETLARVNRLNRKSKQQKFKAIGTRKKFDLSDYGKGVFDWSQYFKY